MKCLVLTNLYPPHSFGGYELTCKDTVNRWRTRGHEVEVLTTATRRPGIADDTGETGIHRVLEWYWADHELLRPSPRERLGIERRNARRLAERLDALRPDVVSLWAMGAMSLSLITHCVEHGVRLTAVAGDDWLTYAPRLDPWVDAWSRRPRRLAAVAAAVTGAPTAIPSLPRDAPVAFVSEFLRQAATRGAVVGFGASEIVPPGIDPTDFPIRTAAARPWQGTLVCVGRVEPRKGFDTVVRALSDLPDVALRLVGPDDGQLTGLLQLADELGVRDRITTGEVPRAELAGIYAAADVCVFPSRWEEPFGLVPLEAMSQATPVVATRRGGSAEYLSDDVNCLAVPPDDPRAIASGVTRLAADPVLRQRLASNGVATAQRYDADSYADRLEALHRRVCEHA
ncbi:MAG: glycosyltransferase family 4 protein [Frankiaceae bacterium]|nr:glycosyltransferase family 4 protein [Frankiaceae bacterium]MBV9871470.1 glycosyltransferase family 4 protein [Frankiaceae bacterium]